MGQNDTIGKIELTPIPVLSSDKTNHRNDIQLFPQLFIAINTYRRYERSKQWNDTSHISSHK